MGKHETVSVEISEAMALTIREAVEAGEFSSASDVVRHALTEWRIAERMPRVTPEDLQGMLEAGLAGPTIPAEEVFDRLEARYTAMVAARENGG